VRHAEMRCHVIDALEVEGRATPRSPGEAELPTSRGQPSSTPPTHPAARASGGAVRAVYHLPQVGPAGRRGRGGCGGTAAGHRIRRDARDLEAASARSGQPAPLPGMIDSNAAAVFTWSSGARVSGKKVVIAGGGDGGRMALSLAEVAARAR